ncbi:hypothetical protein SB30_80035 [Klebsiella quasipneumoniae subsp. similipneumoniae]|nr:hypothetical protein SB30_80035 [Klebsiella quasipneumoniae subsp. similipneumoniae]
MVTAQGWADITICDGLPTGV